MCFICFPNKKFCHNQALTDHLRTHEKEKSYKCKECPKSFYTDKGLTQHVNLHNILLTPMLISCPTFNHR